MKERDYKYSKKLGKKIEPHTLEYIKLCKFGSKANIQKFLDDIEEKEYQHDTEKWIAAGGTNPDHSRMMASWYRGYAEEDMAEVRANKQLTLDEEVLFLHEEEKQILNEISIFTQENKILFKSDNSIPKKREYLKDIVRYNEICSLWKEIFHKEKRLKEPLFFCPIEALRGLEILRIDEQRKELKKLLRRKGYRKSFEKVALLFLDLNKECEEAEIIKIILEKTNNVEDVYDAGRRMILPGSAYSAKR